MSSLCFILGDQLSPYISSLKAINKKTDTILMCEVKRELTYVKHHKKKVVFLFSAMRHFAKDLVQKGYNVIYTKLDDLENGGSFTAEVTRIKNSTAIDRIVVTYPSEYRVLQEVQSWSELLNTSVEVVDDDRFICSISEFSRWSQNRKQMRMEFFYRYMRIKHNILMEAGGPVGGQWNYDKENRKRPKKKLIVPKPFSVAKDNITREVISVVERHCSSHFGDIEPFTLGVTRQHALDALALFVQERLVKFGDYQDAMIESEPWMYHAHLSFYLNCGLLLASECIDSAEQAYYQGQAPLNAVEGFIRQILGWREYIRGIYWLQMPGYEDKNFFSAKKKLPELYWTAETKMNCLKQCVSTTKKHAYAHHIQRLMVLGNFALIAGLNPKHVSEWFLIVYADAYQWVELPNVLGMVLFADGGYLASKPYAAGGSYINRMSDYCKNCQYKVSKKTGADACPFNYLYWNFLVTNKAQLRDNPRLAMMYKAYERMDNEQKELIAQDSKRFLEIL